MGSQKPIIGGYKADLVAVILDRSCAQQLALALAWALGSTGGGKQNKSGYPGGKAEGPSGKLKSVGDPKQVGQTKLAATKKPAAAAGGAAAKKAGAKKTAAKKAGAKKAGAKKPGGSK